MKRKDKENLEFLKGTLQPINDSTTTPDSLKESSIVSLVADKEQTGIKKRKKRIIRTLSSVAAAIVIAIGAGVYIDRANDPKITQMPQMIADAETPLSGNDEQTIIDYFTSLRAEYESKRADVAFNSFGDLLYSAVEDGIAMEKADDADMGIALEESTATGTDSSHGTTNVQVKGIDEDDILKNDGRHLYILSDRNLKIVDAQNMKLLSDTRISITENLIEPQGIYIYGDTLAVIGTNHSKDILTYILLFDIADKAKPEMVCEFSQDGHYFSSRLVDGKIILLSQHSVNCHDLELEDGYAVYKDIAPSVSVNGEESTVAAPMITILPQQEHYSDTYTVMTSIDLDSATLTHKTSAVLGTGSEVYCTNENLYVLSVEYNYRTSTADDEEILFFSSSNSATKIHRFSIKNGILTAEASGEAEGRFLNQFSIDEKNGYVRIATTRNNDSKITVLDKNLKEVASIENIAPGETIQSVRYIGDYGYVVTFRQTDPLFVIDFKDMENPEIVGELKIPGFSSYLHPFNGYLVGIGTDGDENGTVNALKISLFDISDPTNPQEIDRFIIQNAHVESFHKSVMDCSSKDIIGFIYTDYETYKANFCTLRIKEGKIEHIGSYTNALDSEKHESKRYDAAGNEEIFYYDSSSHDSASIRRGTYIGDTLYTVSQNRVCSYPLEGGKMLQRLDF